MCCRYSLSLIVLPDYVDDCCGLHSQCVIRIHFCCICNAPLTVEHGPQTWLVTVCLLLELSLTLRFCHVKLSKLPKAWLVVSQITLLTHPLVCFSLEMLPPSCHASQAAYASTPCHCHHRPMGSALLTGQSIQMLLLLLLLHLGHFPVLVRLSLVGFDQVVMFHCSAASTAPPTKSCES